MRILITGCAGFIGFHLCNHLLCSKKKSELFGIDNLNSYYDVDLKKKRIQILKKNLNFYFKKVDILNYKILDNFVKKNKINIIIHLSAQAGVRYSIHSPRTYLENNIDGFFNILEISRTYKIQHLLFASSSSVYGTQKKFPVTEEMNTDKPDSFYAATKKSNEIMAYSYSKIYDLKITGLRFFTVYGPYGRPDMALFKFTENIFKNKTINLHNKGNHVRDFTYIDDVVYKISKLITKPSKKKTPYQIFNIGNGNPEKLKKFLKIIEQITGIISKKKLIAFQLGDVHKTHASPKKIERLIGYKKNIKIEEGIKKFIKWYKDFYK